jgi:gliding motility-associated-like protein
MELPQPIAQISGDQVYCEGSSTQLTASGGTSYLWSTGETTASIAVSTPGSYTVTSANSCGSIVSAPFTVTQLPLPVPQISGNTVFCSGNPITLTASGGINYLWTTGATTAAITVATAGTYTVNAANGCGTAAASVTVTEQSVQVAFTADVVTGTAPLNVSFTNNSSPGDYAWDFGDGGNSAATDPEYEFSSPGEYTVTLTVSNALGCIDNATVNITVLEEPSSLSIPNVFTPNNDGVNDLFKISADRISDYRLLLYNRWGNVVLETNDPQEGWDGQFNGEPASEGTYFYKLEAKGLDQKDYTESGFFNLVR